MIAFILGGIVVHISPLLSLSGDQLDQMKEANQEYGSFECHNADNLSSQQINDTIIPRMDEIQGDTRSTFILITSPQKLVNNRYLLETLKRAHSRHVLRGVGIDELHLYTEHSFFRPEIPQLKDKFWKHLFPSDDLSIHPIFWAMTATITNKEEMLKDVKRLTTLDLSDEKHHLWPGWEHFQQRDIKMECTTARNIHHIFPQILESLKESSTGKVAFFCTTAANCERVRTQFEDCLNKNNTNKVDVVMIHDKLDKYDKFAYADL